MQTRLEPDAPNTINLVKYLVSELLKREPLTHGKRIVIQISENSPYFPEFTDNILEGDQHIKPEDRMMESGDLVVEKLVAVREYLQNKFKFHTAVMWPQERNVNPLVLDVPLVVLEPKKLYNMARKLGLNTDNKKDTASKKSVGKAKFIENIPALIFDKFKLPIKFGSMQFCLCKIAFKRKVNEPISWDEIAEEIEGHKKADLKTDWRRIYYVFWRLNKTFQQATGKYLFGWENKTFRRLL